MANPYLEGNYAPVARELTEDHPLPVDGVIPPDLDGRLIRNGPNPAVLPADPADYHWFTGDGMLHAVDLRDGQAVGYRNRWVRTRKLADELGTESPRGPAEPVDGPANTHVIRHAGRLLALCESGFAHAVSADLTRARVHDFDAMLTSPMTAHPKVDPDSGELLFFGYDVFGPPFLRSHVADRTGTLVRSEEIDLPRAVMMHDFGVTTTRLVLLDLPVVFDLDLVVGGRSMPFRWDPSAGARVGVLGRNQVGADVRWFTLEPCFAFHVMNAFDDGDRVVIDVVRYQRAFDTPPGGLIASIPPALFRWTIDPAAGTLSEAALDDLPIEFPRIDDTLAGRPYRYGYATVLDPGPAERGTVSLDAESPIAGSGAGGSSAGGSGTGGTGGPSATAAGGPAWAQSGLVKYDLARQRTERFDPGQHRFVSEPVFVRAADGAADDEGWVLATVYDRTTDTSDMVILDATSFSGPPVATIHLPARIPFGFHGSWLPSSV